MDAINLAAVVLVFLAVLLRKKDRNWWRCAWIVVSALFTAGPRIAACEWVQRFRYRRITGWWLKVWYWSIGGDDGRPPPGSLLG